MANRAPQDQDKYVVRFPDGMRDRLKAEAAKAGRSLNNEILHRLLATFGDEADGPEMVLNVPEDLQKRISRAAYRHNATVNEEVVNILLEHFPPPRTPERAAYEIEEIIGVLKAGASMPVIEVLVRKLEELAVDIQSGRVAVPPEVREEVSIRYDEYVDDRLDEMGRPPIGEDE